MKRFLAILITFSLLLCGCGAAQEATSSVSAVETLPQTEQTVPIQPEVPKQLPLSKEELAPIVEKAEISLLAAAFLYDAYNMPISIRNYGRFAYVDDVDEDGQTEMYYSESILLFDPTGGRSCSYLYSPGGAHALYLAQDGSVYYSYYYELTDFEHGDHWDSFCPSVYNSPNPDAPKFMLCAADYCQSGTPMEPFVQIDGTNLSPEESKKFLDELGLTPVTTGLQDYTSFTYDAVYADSITAALENAFGSYRGSYSLDIDRDGETEQVFVYTDFVNTWFPDDALNPSNDPYWGGMSAAYCFDYPGINPVDNRTGLLVADTQGDKLVLSAYTIPQILPTGNISADTYIDKINLYVGGSSYLIPQAIFGQSNLVIYLDNNLKAAGYTDLFYTSADLSEEADNEILCIGKQNENWVLFVIRFAHGIPQLLKTVELSNSACYLSAYEGKNCLVVYHQSQRTNQNGLYTAYSYELLRFDGDEYQWRILSNSVSHYNDQEDATNISDFFIELNRYIVNVIVIYDPFSLHGQQWIAPEKVIHGQVPEAPDAPNQSEPSSQEKIGFVNISNPSSWLNLREGPGREYACILTDPSDPGSIVKQAKGSPVTVLETVESEDAEYPVWYKVRIRYQDHEIIGYSAEAYIELVE